MLSKKRPTLAEFGPLITKGLVSSPTSAPTGCIGCQAQTSAVACATTEESRTALYEPDETPPLALIDESADIEESQEHILQALDKVLNVAPPPLKRQEPSAPPAVVITHADQIQAACRLLPVELRAFIEDELRGRFVAVLKTSAKK